MYAWIRKEISSYHPYFEISIFLQYNHVLVTALLKPTSQISGERSVAGLSQNQHRKADYI
jgi:hypothetical protein